MDENQVENYTSTPHKYLILDENDVVVSSVVSYEEEADPSWIKEPDPEKHNKSGVGYKYVRSKNYFLGPIESEEVINSKIEESIPFLIEHKAKYEAVINTYAFQNTIPEDIKNKALYHYNMIVYFLDNYETYPYEAYRLISFVTAEPELPKFNLENEV